MNVCMCQLSEYQLILHTMQELQEKVLCGDDSVYMCVVPLIAIGAWSMPLWLWRYICVCVCVCMVFYGTNVCDCICVCVYNFHVCAILCVL